MNGYAPWLVLISTLTFAGGASGQTDGGDDPARKASELLEYETGNWESRWERLDPEGKAALRSDSATGDDSDR